MSGLEAPIRDSLAGSRKAFPFNFEQQLSDLMIRGKLPIIYFDTVVPDFSYALPTIGRARGYPRSRFTIGASHLALRRGTSSSAKYDCRFVCSSARGPVGICEFKGTYGRGGCCSAEVSFTGSVIDGNNGIGGRTSCQNAQTGCNKDFSHAHA